MRRPEDLAREALVQIVDALQQRLYLDVCAGALAWNPDKDWECADALLELAGVLSGHELAPDAVLPFASGPPPGGPIPHDDDD